MPRPPKQQTVEDARSALDGVRGQWMRRPGVTAVDVGYKIKDEQLTDDIALRVHVERKIPVGQLGPEDVFNDSAQPDEEVEGFMVDVIEARYGPSGRPLVLDHSDTEAVEAFDRKSAVEPLVGGVSCGNERVTAGTLGTVVFDTETCQPMILSNWHVLAGASSAAVGEAILQPGKLDGGKPADVVATLTRMELDARMDAAVATLDGSRSHSRDLVGLGTITGTDDATLGMEVTKSGRTTGITRGVVDGVSMSLKINYGDPGIVVFNDQIRIVPHPPWPAQDEEVSRGGDSGSVWAVESTNRAIGLHFAGETDPSPTAEHAVCSPIEPVATELRFSFFPVVCEPPPPKPPVTETWRLLLCALFPSLCDQATAPAEAGRAQTPDRFTDDELLVGLMIEALLARRTAPWPRGGDAVGGQYDADAAEALRRLLG